MDVEMGGAEDTAGPVVAGKDIDEISDDGSEDLEAESSGEEDEEEEGGDEEDDAMVDDAPAAGKPGEASGSHPAAAAHVAA